MKRHEHNWQFVRELYNGSEALFICICGKKRWIKVKEVQNK
jgi:hypothetical protein